MLRVVVTAVALGLSVIAQAYLSAGQAPASTGKPAAPAIHIGGVDIDKIIADLKKRSETLIDQPLRVIDAGGYNVGIAVLRRTKPEAQSVLHDRITEVYHVLEGAGTLTTGGTLVDAKPIPAEGLKIVGPGGVGTGIRGGQSRRVTTGDIVIIPTGTPHMFAALEGTIVYVLVRVDTGKVLALQ